MKILYIDNDRTRARALYGDLLSCRGVQWNLSHCDQYDQAISLLQQENFDALLVNSSDNLDTLSKHLENVARQHDCPPILALTENLSPDELLQLVVLGVEECQNCGEVTSVELMRQIRLAAMRRANWKQLESGLDSEQIARACISLDAGDSPQTTEDQLQRLIEKTPLDVAYIALRPDSVTPWKLDGVRLHRFSSLSELVSKLDTTERMPVDALLLEQASLEGESEQTLSRLKGWLPLLPSTILSLETSDMSAMAFIKQGHCDCLDTGQCTGESIVRSIRKSVANRRRVLLDTLSRSQIGANVSDRRKSVRIAASNRRRHARFSLTQSILAIPILPGGAPDLSNRCTATTIDLSLSGVGVRLPNTGHLPSRDWILGFTTENSRIGYIHACLRRASYEDQEIHAGMIFQEQESSFLDTINFEPRLQSDNQCFRCAIPDSRLDQWCEIGVLSKRLDRRIRVCPECTATVTIGSGCRDCGAFDIEYDDLVHHFACAHVDRKNAFVQGNLIECPKCLCSNLVVGADFEIIRSNYHCNLCGNKSDQVANVGNCLRCDLRFPMNLAKEVDIHGYDVERLDLLALVDGAR